MTDWIVYSWVLLSLGIAVLANGRGRSPVGWFFLSLLISPLLAGLALILTADATVAAGRYDELVDAIAGDRGDPISDLERLAALRKAGTITEGEFEAKKADLLQRV